MAATHNKYVTMDNQNSSNEYEKLTMYADGANEYAQIAEYRSPLDEVIFRLKTIEQTQREMLKEFRDFQKQLKSLHQKTTEQETQILMTRDRVMESADHLGTQLVDISKGVKTVMFDQRQLLSSRDGLNAMFTSKLDVHKEKSNKLKARALPNL